MNNNGGIERNSLRVLADLIVQNIKADFESKKMSGNLMNTIQVLENENGIEIVIPARTYNMLLYQTQKVIVHTSHGSYASKLDKEGSSFFKYPYKTRKGSYRVSPRNHIGFVDKAINQGLDDYLRTISSEYKVESKTDTGE
jgi:hypothetical protein